jgi:hypothetical protein
LDTSDYGRGAPGAGLLPLLTLKLAVVAGTEPIHAVKWRQPGMENTEAAASE